MPPVFSRPRQGTGLAILTFDAGGSRALSQLQILENVMLRLNTDSDIEILPCEIFDIIAGVGFGGLIAILLVVFKMTAKEAGEVLAGIGKDVFEAGYNATRRTFKLREAIEGLLKEKGIDVQTKLLQQTSDLCKLKCELDDHVAKLPVSPDMTIVEAALATCATPSLLDPTEVNYKGVIQKYISGAAILPNPVNEVIAAAHDAFGKETKIACLISIGAGQGSITNVPIRPTKSDEAEFLRRVLLDGERIAHAFRSRMKNVQLYNRFSVEQGFQGDDSTTWSDSQTITLYTQGYLQDRTIDKSIERCVGLLRSRVGLATLEQLCYSGGGSVSPPPMPLLSPNFVERPGPMAELVNGMNRPEEEHEQRMLVISGLGGCGKTQLVLKYIKGYSNRYISVFFVDGSSEDRIRDSLTRHVQSLGTEHSQKTFDDAIAFLSLPPEGERLIVFDNVDDPDLNLDLFIPPCSSVSIIITTRSHSRGSSVPNSHIRLDMMAPEEAVDLVLKVAGPAIAERAGAREGVISIAKELDCHPIALVQAGSYMAVSKIGWDDYLVVLRESRKELMKKGAQYQRGMRYSSAYAAFDASYKRLSKHVQETLHLLSFFDRLGFPLELIREAAKSDFGYERFHYLDRTDEFEHSQEFLQTLFMLKGEWKEFHMNTTIEELQNYSFITVTEAPGTQLVLMHSLTHKWAHDCLKGQVEMYAGAAIRLLSCGSSFKRGAVSQHLTKHIKKVMALSTSLHINDKAGLAEVLYNSYFYEESVKLLVEVLKEVEGELGSGHLLVLIANSNLAAAYYNLGQLPKAAKMVEEVLRRQKEILGDQHLNTIETTSNLAAIYHDMEQLPKAAEMREEVLRMRKELLGDQHLDTIKAMSDLAATYSRMGQLSKAAEMEEEVLRMQKELLGDQHLDTIRAMSNLAATYSKMGQLAKAAEMKEEVLRMQKELLGDQHLDTIQATFSLAVTYHEMGQLPKAAEMLEEVLKMRKELLGDQHLDTIRATFNLAATYHDMGQLPKAAEMKEEVMRMRKELLGDQHLDTIQAISQLAVTYQEMGQFSKAAEMQEEVIRMWKELLGDQHLDTIQATFNLAVTYHEMGQLPKAAEMKEEVLRMWKKLLGDQHLDTIKATSSLAITYNKMGQFPKAAKMEEEVLRRRKEILGDQHLDTIEATFNLAVTYHEMGQLPKAAEMLEGVLRMQKELLGDQHLDSITTAASLASTYYNQGHYLKARDLELEVFRLRKEILGEVHLKTLKAMSNLAYTYSALGCHMEAQHLWDEEARSRQLSQESSMPLEQIVEPRKG